MSSPLETFLNQIICGDAKEVLRQLPNESIDCVVTSPPYWALRDYGIQGQLGLEASFTLYIDKLCGVFDEIKRVLKPSGTCWVNLGDTYGGSGTGAVYTSQSKGETSLLPEDMSFLPKTTHLRGKYDKCLLEIPARFAIEMIDRGWVLRNEIIWHKPNVMPSSARDRFTVDFEKIFFFVKSRRYYFAQQFEELCDWKRASRPMVNPESRKKRIYGDQFVAAINPKTAETSRARILERGRNKRCVWLISTRPFRGNHFAVYPPELVATPIKAGCPKGGVVLDPFVGSGTTAFVARQLGRNFIGIDLNAEYVKIAQERLAQGVLGFDQ